jgi:hypothetical protein
MNLLLRIAPVCLLALAALDCTAQDLSPVSVGWTGQPTAGQSLTLTMTVTNIGSGIGPVFWQDEWFLSTSSLTNDVVSGGAFLVSMNKTIAANSSYTDSHAFTLPKVPAGDYYLIGVADIANNISESNETNNTKAVPITLGLPDLSPVSVGWTGQPVAGQSLTLTMTVTNIGSGFASGVWDEAFFLSTNATTNGAVAGGSFTPFAVSRTVDTNSSYTNSHTVTLPNVPPGVYYLIGVADIANQVFESNETNNQFATNIVIGEADLVATNLSWGGPVVAGTNLSVSFAVTNVSASAYSGNWFDGLTLSTTPTLAGAITNWDWLGPHNLSAGDGYVQTRTIPIPAIAAGIYYLIAQADDRDDVPESNKANNLQALQVAITNRPPTITLLSPTNTIQQTSCVPLVFALSANVGLGSYRVTNVAFYDGSVTNVIASLSNAPYGARSQPLDHGTHLISVRAVDVFGLTATSAVSASVFVEWPNRTNYLRADIFSNDCVICMAALTGTNYVIESKTNLASPTWLPLATNMVQGPVLVFTNQRTAPVRFYRTWY